MCASTVQLLKLNCKKGIQPAEYAASADTKVVSRDTFEGRAHVITCVEHEMKILSSDMLLRARCRRTDRRRGMTSSQHVTTSIFGPSQFVAAAGAVLAREE